MLQREEIDTWYTYNEWVETMIVTSGDARKIENILGLVGEAGEVAEKIKKQIRDDTKVSPSDVAREIGDVMFYATALARVYGYTLHDILKMNIEKLEDRKARNKIKGSGDSR